MKWTALVRHRAGTTFVLVFFILYAALSGLLIADALRVYHGIDQRADHTYERTVPLLYLSSAVRRSDQSNGIDLVTLDDGTTALLTTENGASWLYYCREGYLYKQMKYTADDSAERLCSAGSLQLRYVNHLIRADYTASDGGKASLLLSPRSQGGAS